MRPLSLALALALCVPAMAEDELGAELLDAAGSEISDSLLLEQSVYTLQHWTSAEEETTDGVWRLQGVLGEAESHDFTNIYALPLGAVLKIRFPEAYYVNVYAHTNTGNGIYRSRLGKTTTSGGDELVPATETGPVISYEDSTTGKTDGSFAPDEVCTRGQIVTSIYRGYAQ